MSIFRLIMEYIFIINLFRNINIDIVFYNTWSSLKPFDFRKTRYIFILGREEYTCLHTINSGSAGTLLSSCCCSAAEKAATTRHAAAPLSRLARCVRVYSVCSWVQIHIVAYRFTSHASRYLPGGLRRGTRIKKCDTFFKKGFFTVITRLFHVPG